ncbi:MAG: peptidase S9 [Planctomycetes bacterium]|nr:peptidase S9 [Planctomycetota bacterium]
MRRWYSCLVALLLVLPVAAQNRMSPELLWKLGRVGGGTLDPPGKNVLFSVRRYVLADDGGDSDLWTVPLAGGPATPLTSGKGSEGAAQWAKTPDGTRLYVLARRTAASSQVWTLNPETGTWKQITDIEGGIANLKVSPTGDHIAFTRDVKLDATVNDLYKDLPKADARIIDDLMYRHWDGWHDYKYTHLHVAAIKADGSAGVAVDLMQGMKVDCPVPPFAGSEQFNWAPDGKAIAWTAKNVSNWSQSTDSDVYVTDLTGDDRKTRNLTVGMPGYDVEPNWSPDGRHMAFHSMKRAGFESDRNRVMIWDRKTGAIWDLSHGLDRTCHAATWAPDSASVYVESEHRGTNQIFNLKLADRTIRQVTAGQYNWNLRDITPDGSTLVVGRQSMVRPWEIFAMPAEGGKARRLTDVNGDVYAKLDLPTVKERWVDSTDGKKIHCWVIYPPKFDAGRQYPMLTYFQGGPQGQIGQWFSYRWNFHLMAAQGYVVVAPNRRGLPGFGRAWNDQISGDWGGQAMQDILSAHDSMAKESYVDAKRCGGVGASFGGYTAYWMMGNGGDRFSTMIAHCGVFNLESMYGATEELFFVNWDLGGPYWKSPEVQKDYDRFSPHKFVKGWKTPLLVIHGQKDFRVPVTQGMEAFTAARVNGVTSRFLYFPEEGHWIQRPQNGVLWHRVFFNWLGRTCKPAGQ